MIFYFSFLVQISRDRAAVNLLGPVATPQQVINGQLATCLYHCWSRLSKLPDEYSESVVKTLAPTISVCAVYRGLPLSFMH